MVFTAAALAGCASPERQYSGLVAEHRERDPDTRRPASVELTETPFFPDETYYCGPAALATLLVHTSVETTADDLIDQVYLPDRQGSLQSELLGAARRAERIPYVLEKDLADVFEEVRAGHPVLVLQDLGVGPLNQWHYAVVVGFDLDREQVILRSGPERRQVLSLRGFERTHARGDRWAVVITEPDTVPATATPARYLAAVAEMERQERWSPSRRAYQAAIERWPNRGEAWLGLGNTWYGEGAFPEAADAYRRAISVDDNLVAARHNLAWALLRAGQTDAALHAADQAEQHAGDDDRYADVRRRIEAALGEGY